MTPSAVSKLVARLEQRLGTRLLQRSTRQLQLTPEGCAFYERGLRVLADLEEAERCASAHAEPRGRLRVNSNVPFGQHFLLPLLPAFLERNPQVGVDLTLNDEVIDLLEQRTDVAVRAGPLKSSSLVARRLGATRMMIVAAPAYAQRHGLPASVEELQAHNRLDIGHARAMQGWPLLQDGRERMLLPSGNARASNGDALRQLVLGGLGMARLAAFQVQADIAAGRLLHVTQPAISRVLASIELRLGYALFERFKGRLHPTKEARKLFQEVESIQAGVNRLNDMAAGLAGHGGGLVSVVSSPSFGEWLIPAATAKFCARNPGVRIRYRPLGMDALLPHPNTPT
ncbi:hypothetical protein G6F68_011030 [Rhizopus microsporus]|nr:hypothetical protein G6F68_011030 [Rhizopus microsporus]